MSAFLRLIGYLLFLFVAAVVFVIFMGMCARAFWDWLRARHF